MQFPSKTSGVLARGTWFLARGTAKHAAECKQTGTAHQSTCSNNFPWVETQRTAFELFALWSSGSYSLVMCEPFTCRTMYLTGKIRPWWDLKLCSLILFQQFCNATFTNTSTLNYISLILANSVSVVDSPEKGVMCSSSALMLQIRVHITTLGAAISSLVPLFSQEWRLF